MDFLSFVLEIYFIDSDLVVRVLFATKICLVSEKTYRKMKFSFVILFT